MYSPASKSSRCRSKVRSFCPVLDNHSLRCAVPFRYEESEFGEVESLLSEYLSGKADFDQVLRASAGRAPTQTQRVSRDQVGTVEQQIPDIIPVETDGPGGPVQASEFEPAPPIVRPELW